MTREAGSLERNSKETSYALNIPGTHAVKFPRTQSMHSLTSISAQRQTYQWLHQGRSHNIAYDIQGQGSPVLLLPAFSTVSSRTELTGIAQILAPHFQVITLDWLGFGESDRPKIQYNRALYQTLLQAFVQECCPQPLTLVAAGHAAGYAMQLAQDHPDACAKLFLIAPTWKGPLRAMGAPIPVASGIRNLVRSQRYISSRICQCQAFLPS